MATHGTRISVTEITVHTGKTKSFKFSVDDKQITIPVDEAVFANYQNQFYRPNPTPTQRQKFATLMALLRAAYKQGLVDGAKK